MPETLVESLTLQISDSYDLKYQEFIGIMPKIAFVHDYKIYRSNDKIGIFVLANMDINLPSYGVIDGLDIRATEEVLFYLNPLFPYKAPYAMLNRKDFPFEYLPHVNTFISDELILEPNLCLHRGNVDEWFISVGIEEYLYRVKKWIEDATIGELIKHNDGFEPNRIEGFDIIQFDYIRAVDIIQSSCKQQVIDFYSTESIEDPFGNDSICCYVDLSSTYNSSCVPCFLIYDKEQNPCNKYLAKRVSILEDLKTFIDYSLIQRAARRWYNKYKLKLSFFVVIYGIKRPQKVIGLSSEIELLSLIIKTNDSNYSIGISGQEECLVLGHINPFSQEVAMKISNTIAFKNRKTMVLGCGALGSKISLCLARMGMLEQTLVDEDRLLPHNIARHALYGNERTEYMHKAKALCYTINSMYKTELSKSICMNVIKVPFEEINKNDYVVDCTASRGVLDYLNENKQIQPRLIRTEIANNGALGLTFIEGENREPSLFDLRITLFYLSVNNIEISNWLKDSSNSKEDFIHQEFSLGFGCSSDTMILDDATINAHASIVPTVLKSFNFSEGKIIVNNFDDKNMANNYVLEFRVEPFLLFICNQWKLKIKKDVLEILKGTARSKEEEGGILIGHINKYKKIVYIIDYFIPNDNVRSANSLIRGSGGVEDHVNLICKKTSGLITYVGEWHTHPKMGTSKSSPDQHTFSLLARELKTVQYPAVMGILNEDETTFYILEM